LYVYWLMASGCRCLCVGFTFALFVLYSHEFHKHFALLLFSASKLKTMSKVRAMERTTELDFFCGKPNQATPPADQAEWVQYWDLQGYSYWYSNKTGDWFYGGNSVMWR